HYITLHYIWQTLLSKGTYNNLPQIDVSPYSVTERGYSALEKETVSLMCQASSNPASQYVWFYNNSQVYTGPQLTITKILRMHTGNYACLAQNTYLNTRSKKSITLTSSGVFSSNVTELQREGVKSSTLRIGMTLQAPDTSSGSLKFRNLAAAG
uniref:Ig-like domain-containing protein n=1 Tax=Astyanax mexicanus TaxID=7994 RepID=A0A8B9KD97_ASTMX